VDGEREPVEPTPAAPAMPAELPPLTARPTRDPDLDAAPLEAGLGLPGDEPPEMYLRVIANPFLGLFALLVWLAALYALVAWGVAGLLTPIALILLIASLGLLPGCFQYHCLDCGATGPLRRWKRHVCPRVAERRFSGLGRRWRGPPPAVQVILWLWLFAMIVVVVQRVLFDR
jgi:hypothetical protein